MIRSLISAALLSLLLVTGANCAEFSADLFTQTVGGTDKGKIYFRNENISRTEMMGMISIMKRPLIYQLFTDTQKYVVTNLDEIKDRNPLADTADFEEWIGKNHLKKVGSETLQGFECDIFEGDIQFAKDHDPVHVKLWQSRELGYPIRHEGTLPEQAGTVISYLENIQTGKQADSLFEIPADYSKAKNMQEALGMGGMPALGDYDEGQMPSQEELQKMMKEMMKMMEKQ
ncbi:DUF4412 domain-containing protein [Desulfoferrobacter suflitae]|uniref:DUF4412 domain-containing protein n=1 Tax=Desulfoferrobacter suflitae TaxID=2865782 RepID=UPI0021641AA1|nr:DUF4412 domain-containing protein [Desulfoferrobacter suflitae]MCK8600381.1 DUF4412 domain-containing protein [Desulfoferrobacter suflitae]